MAARSAARESRTTTRRPACSGYSQPVRRRGDRGMTRPRTARVLPLGPLRQLGGRLREHAVAELIFGGTANQPHVLGGWPRPQTAPEGRERAVRRAKSDGVKAALLF